MTYRFPIRLWLIFLLALSFSGLALAAEDMNSGIIYGDHHAFVLSAPPGWVLDNKSGVHQGLYAVFYPKGSSWDGSEEVMYANTSGKDKGDTVNSFIKYDVDRDKKEDPNLKVEDAPSLPIGNGRKVPVKYFLGDSHGNYEAVAYVDEKYIVAFLVFTARDEKTFRKDLPLFSKLVASYRFLTDKVKDEDFEGPPVDYSIPRDILSTAQQLLVSPEGEKYDKSLGDAFGSRFADYMNKCTSGADANGWHRIVFVVNKDGTVTHIYAEKHDSVNDCLVPKLRKEHFPPAPSDSFYYLFELNVKN